jgi:hypothetical protein
VAEVWERVGVRVSEKVTTFLTLGFLMAVVVGYPTLISNGLNAAAGSFNTIVGGILSNAGRG